jgi:hypothetical protein
MGPGRMLALLAGIIVVMIRAMVALLAKLPTFEGRSRFTTWA